MQIRWLVVGAALGLVLAVAPSCGGQAHCSASNCAGCCDANGQCQQGTTGNACGNTGNLCTVCAPTENCQLGTCVATNVQACNAQNCANGCCTSSGCQAGNTASACGTGGALCITCNGGQSCVTGLCTGSAGGGSGGGVGGGTGGGTGGGVGGGTGGGVGGGAGGGGGTSTDGGTVVTVAQARTSAQCSHLVIQNVVVTAIDSLTIGNLGDAKAQFWVSDRTNPNNAIYVDKFYTDTPTPYAPAIGDVLTLDGYRNDEPSNADRIGYRTTFRNEFACPNTNTGKLQITLLSTATPPSDATMTSGSGNAQNGAAKPNPNLAGRRVFIPGPLTLTNPNPTAFARVSQAPNDQVHFGFEVTGGVLVNNYKTFGNNQPDGGIRCDYRAYANDAGTVTFPNGIHGVWDSYTHAPCNDGGTSSSCTRVPGFIPQTTNDFTYVLYPQDCSTDLVGVVQ